MSNKEYRKPEYNALEFTCPHCNELVLHESISYEICTFSKVNVTFGNNDLFNYQQKYIWDGKDPSITNKTPLVKTHIEKSYDALADSRIVSILFITRICSKCGSRCYWEIVSKIPDNVSLKDCNLQTEYSHEVKLIYPQISLIDKPNKDMDQKDKDWFNEARDIFDRSPKAAGALLRSVLESILRKKFFEKHSTSMLGSILNDNVVKNMLGNDVMSVCETCKLIGNNASHSNGLALLIDENEQKEQVILLFKLINLVANEIISEPLKKKNLLNEAKEVGEKLTKNKDKD